MPLPATITLQVTCGPQMILIYADCHYDCRFVFHFVRHTCAGAHHPGAFPILSANLEPLRWHSQGSASVSCLDASVQPCNEKSWVIRQLGHHDVTTKICASAETLHGIYLHTCLTSRMYSFLISCMEAEGFTPKRS